MPRPAMDCNLFEADAEILLQLDHLPHDLQQARDMAKKSAFVKRVLPAEIIQAYMDR